MQKPEKQMTKGKNSFLYFVNVTRCLCFHKFKLKIKFALKINKSDKILNMYNSDIKLSSPITKS